MFFLLTGCSWQEYFIIVNNSSSEIIVEYLLEEDTEGFKIFEKVPEIYKVNGRVFNLKNIKIYSDKEDVIINKEEFDVFLRKKKDM